MDKRPDFSIGVISFYSAQVQEILCQLEAVSLAEKTEDATYRLVEDARETRDRSGRLKERLRVGSVDAFQGKEFDVVFLSMTRSNSIEALDEMSLRRKYGHLMLENRLCVAMSRQQRLLVVVGDSAMLKSERAKQCLRGLDSFHEMTGGAYGKRLRA
jgi:superfamily I DNA and/or RNA helicase